MYNTIYQFIRGSQERWIYNGLYIFDIKTFKPEFIIVIFIHYKPRIAVAILDL